MPHLAPRLAPLLLPLLPAAAGPPVASLAHRHDVAAERFLELGAEHPAVAFVGGLGSGTLVAPRWVLTAAHVPEMVQRMTRGESLTVTIAGESYTVARVEAPYERELDPERHDIALLELDRAVPDAVAPVPLFLDDLEPGTEFVLAGWGVLARGDEGAVLSRELMASPTRALRAGRNVIEELDLDAGLAHARFDAPGEGLPLEAAPCVGDSGGPLLVRTGEGDDAGWAVAGVIAALDDADGDRVVSEYGETFAMTLVGLYAGWIEETIGG